MVLAVGATATELARRDARPEWTNTQSVLAGGALYPVVGEWKLRMCSDR